MWLMVRFGLAAVMLLTLNEFHWGVHLNGFRAAVFAALVIALLNSLVRPILILLTLPATLFSLGLFIFVINAGMVVLADRLLDGFAVSSWWWALFVSWALSFANAAAGRLETHYRNQDISG